MRSSQQLGHISAKPPKTVETARRCPSRRQLCVSVCNYTCNVITAVITVITIPLFELRVIRQPYPGRRQSSWMPSSSSSTACQEDKGTADAALNFARRNMLPLTDAAASFHTPSPTHSCLHGSTIAFAMATMKQQWHIRPAPILLRPPMPGRQWRNSEHVQWNSTVSFPATHFIQSRTLDQPPGHK